MSRKEPKPKRLSNKALIESALEDLQKETGFHFTDIKFGNGYFIFTFEKNTVCHFHVKELPGFLFAIWNTKNINLEYYDSDCRNAELVLFAQAELTLDKFKPSNSGLRVFMSRYVCKPNDSEDYIEEWDDLNAIRLLKYMKKYKLRAFYYSQFSHIAFYDYVPNYKILEEYIHTRWYYFKDKLKYKLKRFRLKHLIVRRFKNLRNTRCMLIDKGPSWSPRLDLVLYENRHVSNIRPDLDNKLQKIYDLLEEKYYMDVSLMYTDSKKKFKKITNFHLKNKHADDEEVILWMKL